MKHKSAEPTSKSDTLAKQSSVKHSGYYVIFGLFFFSSALGLYAYYNYNISEKHLIKSLALIREKGKTLSYEQCVQEIIDWAPHCEAMKSLCDASGPRLMEGCLSARDRTQECAILGDSTRDTHFGFKECKARNLPRNLDKACGKAYRAMDSHCHIVVGKRG